MTAEPCAYPLFRQRFLQPLACGDGNAAAAAAAPPPPACAPADPALSPTKAAARMGGLRVLDLRALPRDDGPPTELRARKEKLAHYERQCSRVAPGLYVGAEWVAKSRAALAEAGITHVVNCVGFLYPPYFEPELAYQTLYLQGALPTGRRVLAGRPPACLPACPPACLPGLLCNTRWLPERSDVAAGVPAVACSTHQRLRHGLPAAVPQTRPARTSCACCTTSLTS